MKKTEKMMKGVIAAALVSSLTACGQNRPAQPSGTDCNDWEWDSDTGTYYCDDRTSSRSGYYYYGGAFYSNKNALRGSSNYQSYEKSFKSGIGSGSKGGYGG
ncbi:hypothetical protein JMM81_11925 [Bacillus sp. V3B]|uniref:hypothetical protein n=1 Tax=Bacillus sp. V3B TaxID=2804915 RepID=UPI002108C870|nr:hypothetical protein [Bacillus sp. V3B]MCQ6275667.1 hypothetical protein [Bacillus sp. V3B]